MHRPVSQQLGIGTGCAVLALMFGQVPKGTEVNIVRQVFTVRDLLEARFGQEPPHQIVRRPLMLVGVELREVPLQRQEPQDLRSRAGESHGGFRAPALLERVKYHDVVAPIIHTTEAVADVFEHGHSRPGEHLHDILQKALEWNLEIPVEIARPSVVDRQFFSERHEGIFYQSLVVLPVSPQMNEEIVPEYSGKPEDIWSD
jgi:hypothetical protein